MQERRSKFECAVRQLSTRPYLADLVSRAEQLGGWLAIQEATLRELQSEVRLLGGTMAESAKAYAVAKKAYMAQLWDLIDSWGEMAAEDDWDNSGSRALHGMREHLHGLCGGMSRSETEDAWQALNNSYERRLRELRLAGRDNYDGTSREELELLFR